MAATVGTKRRRHKPADKDAIIDALEKGASLDTAAAHIGFSGRAVREWMHLDPDFCERVDLARRKPDKEVENSLYRIATRVRNIEPICKNAHEKGRIGHAVCDICRAPIAVEVPDGDFRAQEFWLTNRQRQEWRKRWDVMVENAVPREQILTFVQALGEAIREHVGDPSAKRAILDAFEAAASGLGAGGPTDPDRGGGGVPQVH